MFRRRDCGARGDHLQIGALLLFLNQMPGRAQPAKQVRKIAAEHAFKHMRLVDTTKRVRARNARCAGLEISFRSHAWHTSGVINATRAFSNIFARLGRGMSPSTFTMPSSPNPACSAASRQDLN